MATFPATLTELVSALRSDRLLITDYCSLLEQHFTSREPSLLAFVPEENRFARLRRDAEALLTRYPDPATRPPLFGVPVGVKDIFHVEGFTTRAGSKLPPELFQGTEAASVTALKNAGALILGKTVTTEFAYFGPGPTHNPHNPEHTPGGSSSGSAAAVAAGLAPLTLGTQTIGSVVRPASFCGVVGFKPTSGRISTAGVLPLSTTLDHVGFFTNDVASARLAASSLVSDWVVMPHSASLPILGIPEDDYLHRASMEMLMHFRETCKRFDEAGYTLVPTPLFANFQAIYDAQYIIVDYEIARYHGEWFAQYSPFYHSKTQEHIARGLTITEADYQAALRLREQTRTEVAQVMTTHHIDAWLTPAAVGPAPKGLDSTGDPVMNLPWSFVGFPSLNLPNGSINGLPVGLQLVSNLNTDEQLFALAENLSYQLSVNSHP